MKSFTVLYYKSKKKKHKSKGESKFDGTMTICPDRSIVSLMDENGQVVFKSIQTDLTKRSQDLQEDEIIQLGGHEIEILSIDDSHSGGGGGDPGTVNPSSSSRTFITNHRATSSTMASSSSLHGKKRGLGTLTSTVRTTTSAATKKKKKKTTVAVGRDAANMRLGNGGIGREGFSASRQQSAFIKRVPPPQPKRSSITAVDSRRMIDDCGDGNDNDSDLSNNNIVTNTKKHVNPVPSKENPSAYNGSSSSISKSITSSTSSRLLATNKTKKTFRPVPRNYQSQQQIQEQRHLGQSSASANMKNTSDAYNRAATTTTTNNNNNGSSNDNIFSGAIGRLSVPHSIKSVLKPHQIDGLVFLWNKLSSPASGFGSSGMGTGIEVGSMSGAILADEMGLGKTLQTIAVIAA